MEMGMGSGGEEARYWRQHANDLEDQLQWCNEALCVAEAQASGLIREDVDPFISKWAFFGALDELSIQWVLSRNRDRFDLDVAAKQVVETFFRGVLAAKSQE